MPSVLVTGSNRGIGLEFARQYAAEGWRVHATCRDPAHAAELRAVDRTRFASVGRLQDAHGTPAMPDAATVAKRIAELLPTLRTHPSGSFLDLRTLPA